MAVINLYKIDDEKKSLFFEKLPESFEELSTKNVKVIENSKEVIFQMGLYYDSKDEDSRIAWEWVIKCFDADGNTVTKQNPQGIVTVEYEDAVYAVSFSYAYYMVDKYCDRDFPFKFGRKLNYDNIKTTALTNPNLQKNKTVNNFIDYENINFDSGEALTKLKAYIKDLPEQELFKKSIELGNSIKFTCDEPSLEKIASIIIYVENIIKTKKDVVFIPRFDRVKDKDESDELTKELLEKANEGNIIIDFSEYQIFATNIIFNDCDEYEFRYHNITSGKQRKKVDDVNMFEIENFAKDCGVSVVELIENCKVHWMKNGISMFSDRLINRAFATNEEKNAIFQEGKWYIYNSDYLNYMNNSISEIDVLRIPSFDFVTSEYNKYIDAKYDESKDDGLYSGLKEEEIKNRLRRKYYLERYYNDFLSQHGFFNMDRELEELANHKYETADLYKNDCLYTVKIGKSSSKLCYAVDQSIISLNLYHQKIITSIKDVKEFGLILILERSNELPVIDEKPDLTSLKMIILKNKLDYWKKEVRLKGYIPKIFINYIQK